MEEDINKHYCELESENANHKDIVKTLIDTGLFVEWRRKLRRLTMISPSHPLTGVYIRSAYQFNREEKRHLLLTPYMIHPFSMFTLWFNFAMNLAFLYIYIPFYIEMVLERTIARVRLMYYVTLPLYIPLIISSCLTGYFDKESSCIKLSFRSVCWRYFKTYLFFDMAFIAGFFVSVLYVKTIIIVAYVGIFGCTAGTFFRYPYFFEGCRLFKMYTKMNMWTYSILSLTLTALITLWFTFAYAFSHFKKHWGWPVWLMKVTGAKKKVNYLLELKRLYAYVELILNVGFNNNNKDPELDSHYTSEMVAIIFIPLGFVFMLILAVQIMQIWMKYYSAQGKSDQIKFQFQTYMDHLGMPSKMNEKQFSFLDFKYQKKIYDEKKLNTMLSDKLQKEILLNATKSKLEQVEFFKNVPDVALKKLMNMMKVEYYMPGDVIIKAGATGTCMFFISVGTVVVTTRSGKEVCVLKDGAQLGEIALITKAERVANATAVTPCELYRLKRNHFQQVMRKYPQLLEIMTDEALGRIANTKEMGSKYSGQRLKSAQSEDSTGFELDESDDEMFSFML